MSVRALNAAAAVAVATAAALALLSQAARAAEPSPIVVDIHGPASGDARPYTADLARWARDTWRSLDAMTPAATGLPADSIDGDLGAASRSGHTSPTNIGGYLWSVLAVRDAGIISATEARDRVATTVTTLENLERHAGSGMFYNWYDPATGAKLTTWPGETTVVNPFLSTVDNGWLAAALRMVERAFAESDPDLAVRARTLSDVMDFGVFFDPQGKQPLLPAGTNRGGFWDAEPVNQASCPAPAYNDERATLWYTCHHYDTTVSESRIATYLGIANGQIPTSGLFGTFRTMPAGCDWSWQEQQPIGTDRQYDGLTVFEGSYGYDGMRFVPSWGGSMFEALMPALLVPEEEWGPDSWGLNHPITVAVQKKHGLDAGYGYWGFSPASDPGGGYAEYGVDLAGMRSDGYASDRERTDVDTPYGACGAPGRGTAPDPMFGDGVVTPHAAFLALRFDADGAVANLRAIESELHAYGPGGFFDAVAVRSGTSAQRYLSLDQSMVLAAIGNALADDAMRRYFVDEDMEATLRPLMAQQVFSAAWAPRTAEADPAPATQPGPVGDAATQKTTMLAESGYDSSGGLLSVAAACAVAVAGGVQLFVRRRLRRAS